jgi:hypothetical protein
MKPKLLTELIRTHTATSSGSLTPAMETLMKEMAREILRDHYFRAEMQQLLRAALEQALKEFNEETGG